ncbi:VOC family protein [Ruoffia tabacinasalis]|uniref:VOC family protein n=1 Tax=Ruoffia tabacinasalis TaxID=87458 RepID=UPI003F9D7A69
MKKKTLKTIIALFLLALVASPLTAMAQDDASSDAVIYPASYQLNSMDSLALADFYENNMGMTILEEADGYYRLGTSDKRTLLEIFPTDIPRGDSLSTGLYHTAFLFNDREYMGSALNHLMETQSPIEGFTYHGVSDAIYAADIEGNGIELYWDYPEEEWPQGEGDNSVEMLNEPLDYVELMESATEEFTQLDERTKIGHFHLVSDDFDAAGEFYIDVFGLNTQSYVEGDSFFQASGSYHHHIANNNWFADQGITQPEEGQQGLRATVWETQSEEFFNEIISNLDSLGADYTQEDNLLSFNDASGLGVIVEFVSE